MWVIEDHLRPSGHIMPDHAGDRGAVPLVLEPHDHLHINQNRMSLLAWVQRQPPVAAALSTITPWLLFRSGPAKQLVVEAGPSRQIGPRWGWPAEGEPG